VRCAKLPLDPAEVQTLSEQAPAPPNGGSVPAPLLPLLLVASVPTSLAALTLTLCDVFIKSLGKEERALLQSAVYHGTLRGAGGRGSSALKQLEPDPDGCFSLRAGTPSHADAEASFASGGRHSRVDPDLPAQGTRLWAARNPCATAGGGAGGGAAAEPGGEALRCAIQHTLQRALAAGWRGPFCINLIVLTSNHAAAEDFFVAGRGNNPCAVTSCSRAVLRVPDSGTGGGDNGLADAPGWIGAQLSWQAGVPACQVLHNTSLVVDPRVAAAAAAAAAEKGLSAADRRREQQRIWVAAKRLKQREERRRQSALAEGQTALEGEAPLLVPEGFEIVAASPTEVTASVAAASVTASVVATAVPPG